jgi:hypothetical protein
MALAYVPPGITVEELYSPSVNPLLTVGASVCLVGLARGYEYGVIDVSFTAGSADPVEINAPEDAVFQGVDGDTVFESATGVSNTTQYVEGTDFDATLAGDATSISLTSVAATPLRTNGGVVRLKYRYVPDRYYEATRLDSQAAVEARFGPAWDTNGIDTPLTAAAALAFQNGASSVVLQPLFRDNAGSPTQPTAAEAASRTQWEASLYNLRDVEDINIIVPIMGQSDANVDDTAQLGIFEAVSSHIAFMKTQGQYIVGIYGEDSTADVADATLTTLRSHAGSLRTAIAEQLVLISPSRFSRVSPNSARQTDIGGQYVAAAVAGMLAARPVSVPLTRKQVSGVTSVTYPNYDKVQKDADAQDGLFVVEQKGTSVQVRHAVTLDNTSTANRELSVVRAKHRMIESIRQTIDEQIIGTVPADGNAPLVVKNAVIGVLETLQQRRELVDYSGVQARTLTNDPTTVECRFSYRPAFPLNYVNVKFSLDLSAGEVTTTFGELTV